MHWPLRTSLRENKWKQPTVPWTTVVLPGGICGCAVAASIVRPIILQLQRNGVGFIWNNDHPRQADPVVRIAAWSLAKGTLEIQGSSKWSATNRQVSSLKALKALEARVVATPSVPWLPAILPPQVQLSGRLAAASTEFLLLKRNYCKFL